MASWEQEKDESRATFQKRIDKQVRMADIMRRERIRPDDLDFKEKVSPYMAGEIDPSIAVHHDLDIPEYTKLNLGGYSNVQNPHSKTFFIEDAGFNTIDFEPNTVAALHNNNTPYIYGHEYRHHNYPELRENDNRLVDMIAAQTDSDVDESLRYFANRNGRTAGVSPSDSLSSARKRLNAITEFPEHNEDIQNVLTNESGVTTSEETKNLINSSKTKQFLNDEVSLSRWKKGLKRRNQKRKNKQPETMADSLRAAYAALGMEEFE